MLHIHTSIIVERIRNKTHTKRMKEKTIDNKTKHDDEEQHMAWYYIKQAIYWCMQ